ncbi:MAG: 2-oxoglutarate dehydrogenase E1 component [Myxococcales bacterium]|nr:2-oxoglutarate dehydrogenase E1 component [Myxococcales bacterium]
MSPANAWNGDYIEELYEQWLHDDQAVPETWRNFFEGFALAQETPGSVDAKEAAAQARVIALIDAYRREGHFVAALDPLGNNRTELPELELSFFGFGTSDLDRVFDVGTYKLKDSNGPRMKLRDILESLKKTYCRSMGVEYMHIQDLETRQWLQHQMETTHNEPVFDKSWKLFILKGLTDAEVLESFTHTRYPGQKRFSLEGGEALIPAMRYLAEKSAVHGVEEIVLGMAHRGRLNVLANIMGMSYEDIFSQFEGYYNEDSYGDGDVKYHKGFSYDYKTREGKDIHLSLTSNPSHLEAVNPVVQGRARAKQRQHGDTGSRRKVLPLLMHGDAAFAGQGLVAETLNLSQLKGYRTGGTIHIIINNQIGFTTSPEDARSTTYATDVAKMIEAPIFHVNGDDAEAVIHAMDLALRFRQEFGRDIVIDMLCYRKHGHNESDEPAFTQPLMYRKIKQHPTPRKGYAQKLMAEGSLSEDEEKQIFQAFQDQLQDALEKVRQNKQAPKVQAYEARWIGLDHAYDDQTVDTSVSHDMLLKVGKALTSVPEGFALNKKVARKLPDFFQAIEQGGTIDWAQGELLGFGSLLYEGTPVRLSGQDSARGTFSHRHAVWQDIETQDSYAPLNHIDANQAHFCVYNSLLSEAAVLGFDFGYALSEPQMLILWEAQFGDFANGAQVIIDQFIVSSDSKWQRTNGITMLLPHGYEGQGPEHSHAYLERYLQACAENNIQVCNLTTPAQYFHALRRQMRRPFRRPLIIMAPKSLLRHPRAQSPITDLTDSHFHEILPDPNPKTTAAKRLLLCSGKVYYDLLQRQEKEEHPEDTAIVRVEQFYPFCHWRMKEIKERYAGAKDVFWVQEEPQNRGGWAFMLPYLFEFFEDKPIAFVGRDASASPATASFKRHVAEQEAIVEHAFTYQLSDAERKRRSFTTIAV